MKAVSPLVSTAILLVATIAGGLILYNYLVNTISAPKDFVSITPISASLVVINDTTGQLNMKVSCIGTKPANLNKVVIYPGGITENLTNVVVKPGETLSITLTITLNETLDLSTRYYATIYYDGNQATEPIEVRIIW